MNHVPVQASTAVDLRQRALSHLACGTPAAGGRASASEALSVLYQLASSPATAADALAVLHELQVHQVELDLQAEELRASRVDIEAALRQQLDLYDRAPVALLTVDTRTVLCDLNQAAARLLGRPRSELLGRALATLLLPASGDRLQTLLVRVNQGHADETCALQLTAFDGALRTVQASAAAAAAGGRFVLALVAAVAAVQPRA